GWGSLRAGFWRRYCSCHRPWQRSFPRVMAGRLTESSPRSQAKTPPDGNQPADKRNFFEVHQAVTLVSYSAGDDMQEKRPTMVPDRRQMQQENYPSIAPRGLLAALAVLLGLVLGVAAPAQARD